MMFPLNYDLARQILEERRAQARTAAELRRAARTQTVVPRRDENAEVIELEFGAHCETEQIGA